MHVACSDTLAANVAAKNDAVLVPEQLPRAAVVRYTQRVNFISISLMIFEISHRILRA